MPNIQEYNSEVNPESTISTKQADGASIGPGLEKFGAGVSELGSGISTYQARRETGMAASKLSSMQIGAISKIKDLKSSLDPDGIRAFMDEFDAGVNNLRPDFATSQGSEFLEKQNRYTRDMVFNNLLAKNASLQGQEDAATVDKLSQNYKTAVYNDPDDSTWEHATQAVGDGIDGMHTKGDANAEKLKGSLLRDMAINRFDGAIFHGGAPGGWQRAQDLLDSGTMDKYLNYNSPDKNSDQLYIQSKINAARKGEQADATRSATSFKTAQAAANLDTENMFAKMLYAPKEAGANLNSKTVLDSNLPPSTKRTWLQALERSGLGTDSTDPATYNRLRSQIDSGEISSVDQLKNPLDRGHVSTKDYAKLTTEMMAATTPQGKIEAKNYQRVIDDAKDKLKYNNYGGIDTGMEENLYAFEHEAREAYDKGRSQGFTADQLTNPDSPNYIGNLANKYKARWSPILERFLAEHHVAPPVPVSSVPTTLGVKPTPTPPPSSKPSPITSAAPGPTPVGIANTPLNVPIPPSTPAPRDKAKAAQANMIPEGATGTYNGHKVKRVNGKWEVQ